MDAQGIFRQHCQRSTTTLFKGFLMMLEDLQVEHQINFNKLRKNLPNEYSPIVDQANYFDGEKLQHLRKRTLDIGNETIRVIEGELENFTINFIFNH